MIVPPPAHRIRRSSAAPLLASYPLATLSDAVPSSAWSSTFRILGPLEVSSPARAVRLGGPRQRSVLAILLLDANRVVSIERLADELYGERHLSVRVTQVHRQISELRSSRGSAGEHS